MKIKRKGFVVWCLEPWAHEPEFYWREYRITESDSRIVVGEQEIEMEVPDNFDPRGHQIDALEAQKRDITAKFQAAVTEINARISKLQAITFEPSESTQ